MEVKATLEERTSKKGNSYQCLVVKLTPTYEKLVFLDSAEIELLKSQDTSKSVSDFEKRILGK